MHGSCGLPPAHHARWLLPEHRPATQPAGAEWAPGLPAARLPAYLQVSRPSLQEADPALLNLTQPVAQLGVGVAALVSNVTSLENKASPAPMQAAYPQLIQIPVVWCNN